MLLQRLQKSARAGNGKGRLPWRKWPVDTDPPFFVTSALPQRIKLDIQGEGERERGKEREREGKRGRERDEKKGSGRNIFPMSG